MNERILELLIKAKNATGPGLREAQKAVSGFASRAKSAMRKFGGIAGSVLTAFRNNWLGAVAAIYAVQRAIKSVINVVHAWGVATSAMFEGFEVQLETTLGSLGRARDLMKWISVFAAKTPFEIPELVETSILLQNIGLDAKKTLEIVGNTAASFGRSITEVGQALASMNRMVLLRYGLDVSREANKITIRYADQWGKIQEVVKEGGLEVQRATLLSIWNERYKGGMERFSNTFEGMWSNLQDAITMFKDRIGKAGIFDHLKLDLKALLDLLDQWAESGKLDRMAKSVSNAFEALYASAKRFVIFIVRGVGQVVDTWNELKLLANSLRIGVLKIALAWQHLRLIRDPLRFREHLKELDRLKKEIGEIEEENEKLAAQAIIDYSEKWGGSLQDVIDKIDAIRAGLAEKVPEAVETATGAIVEGTENATEAISTFSENFKSKINDARDAALDLGSRFGEVMVSQIETLSNGIGEAFSGMIMEGESFGEAMKNVFRNMASQFIQQVTSMIVKWMLFTALTGGGGGGFGLGSLFGGLFRHSGGMIRKAHSGLAPDEVPVIAQSGEGILSRKGMQALGGASNLNRLNSGESVGGAGVVNHNYYIQAVDPRSFSDLVQRNPEAVEVVVSRAIGRNSSLRKNMQEGLA